MAEFKVVLFRTLPVKPGRDITESWCTELALAYPCIRSGSELIHHVALYSRESFTPQLTVYALLRAEDHIGNRPTHLDYWKTYHAPQLLFQHKSVHDRHTHIVMWFLTDLLREVSV